MAPNLAAPNGYPKVPAEKLAGQGALAPNGNGRLPDVQTNRGGGKVFVPRPAGGGGGGNGKGGGGKKFGTGKTGGIPRADIRQGHQLAASTYGPTIHQDNSQIGVNNRQGAAAQRLTAALFTRLGHFTQRSTNEEKRISGELAAQLAGLGAQSGGYDTQISRNAQRGLGLYTPQADENQSQLSRTAGMQALTHQLAIQRGLNNQDTAAYQGTGALQGANYQGLSASNVGTYALSGQQEIGNIGQASRLANEPIISQIAALRAKEGTLAAADAVKLKQQAVTNNLTRRGLGLKNKALNVTAQANAQNFALGKIEAGIKASEFRASQALGWAQLGEKKQNDLANQANAQAAINQRAAAAAQKSGGGSGSSSGVKPLSTVSNNVQLTMLGSAVAFLRENVGKKQKNGNVSTVNGLLNVMQAGNASGLPRVNNTIAIAASELYTWGHISPKTLAALHAMGMTHVTFNGAPIKVGPPPRGFTG